MSKYSFLLKMLFVLLPFQGFCLDRFLEPVRFENQKEIYFQGGLSMLSEKENTVLFYQTNECLMNGKANFYFVITNESGDYLNFLTHQLRVTDQFGRRIRIIPVEEHLQRLKQEANVKSFLNFAIGGLDLWCAQGAGRVDYYTHSRRHVRGGSTSFDRFRGPVSNHYHHHEERFEHGTFYCDALRRAAEREALIEASFRGRAICDEFQMRRLRYENFYFTSNTIYPDQVYSANFQIDVPKYIQQDLQYLFFSFDLCGETHTFSMFCGCKRC